MPCITNYVKSQRIKWYGHAMGEGNTERIKVTINWDPNGKRPRGKSKKRWKDKMKEGMEQLGITNWEDYTQDRRESWRLL